MNGLETDLKRRWNEGIAKDQRRHNSLRIILLTFTERKTEFLHYSSTRHPYRCNNKCIRELQRWFISFHSSPTRHPHIAYHSDIEQVARLIHSSPFSGWRVGIGRIACLMNLFSIRYLCLGDKCGDEWYGVNQSYNPQCHNNLQHYGWRVTSFLKTLFLNVKLQSLHYSFILS